MHQEGRAEFMVRPADHGYFVWVTAVGAGAAEDVSAWTSRTCAVRVSDNGLRRAYARVNSAIWLVGCTLGFGFAAEGAVLNAGSTTAIRAGMIVILVVDLAVSVRIARAAIVVDNDRLTARSVLRTRHFASDEIKSIDRPAVYGTFRRNGVRIHLDSGRTVATGVFNGTPIDATPGRAQVAELNAWLFEAHHGRLRPTPGVRPLRGTTATVRRLQIAWTIILLLGCATLLTLLVGVAIDSLIYPST